VNFSEISNHSVVGRILRSPLKLIPEDMPMPILQGKLRGKKWIAGAHTHGCWLGSYEQGKQVLFAGRVGEGEVVFDIGANVGFYTLLASTLVGAGGHVYAFEPLPRNIDYLRQHLLLNQVNNVTVIEAAASAGTGFATFEDGGPSAMGHLSLSGSLQVKTVGIDDLISRGIVRSPDVLKLDVEGDEMLVLSGARSALERSKPTIFLATHGPQVHREACEFLRSLDYQLESISPQTLEETDELIAFCRP